MRNEFKVKGLDLKDFDFACRVGVEDLKLRS